jgi:hypothetical protein
MSANHTLIYPASSEGRMELQVNHLDDHGGLAANRRAVGSPPGLAAEAAMTSVQEAHQPSIGWSCLAAANRNERQSARPAKNRVFNLGQPTDAIR